MNEQWLSIVEYARAFNISDMTIRRRIRNGKIPAVLRDGKYYIPVSQERTESDIKQPFKSFTKKPETISTQSLPTNDGRYAVAAKAQIRPNSIHIDQYNQRSQKQMDEIAPGDESAQVNKRLVEYCENSLKKLERMESLVRSEYECKIIELSAKLEAKEVENRHLAQQIEDLQLLIKIVEKR